MAEKNQCEDGSGTMNDGFLRVMAITPDVKTGDVKYNLEAVRKAVDEAVEAGASLLVLPELCLTSAGCQDLLLQGTLVADVFSLFPFRSGGGGFSTECSGTGKERSRADARRKLSRRRRKSGE